MMETAGTLRASIRNGIRWPWLAFPLLYCAGAIGIHTEWREFFLSATPLLLLISTGACILSQQERALRFLLFVAAVMASGFFVEVAGVHTGMIFGTYTYGEVLGMKWLGVPLVIGANWYLVTALSGWLSQRLFSHPLLIALAGAALCTALDVLIEPSAIRLGFWSWQDGNPPLQNYAGWFAFSFIMQGSARLLKIDFNPSAAPALWTGHLLFFLPNLLLS